MRSDKFEWDAEKAKRNLAKHGITFDEACLVFRDFFAYDRCQFDSNAGEFRYLISGDVNGSLLTVAYTERGGRI